MDAAERLAADRMQEAAKAVTMLTNAASMVTLMPPEQQRRWVEAHNRATAAYLAALDLWVATQAEVPAPSVHPD